MREALTRPRPAASIVPVEQVTEGAACTVLLARRLHRQRRPADARQQRPVGGHRHRRLPGGDGRRSDADGLIMTMKADDPKWSFVGLDARSVVTRVVEKQVMSNEATVGIYNFRRGSDFVRAADTDDRQEPARQQRVLRRADLQPADPRRRADRGPTTSAPRAWACTGWARRKTCSGSSRGIRRVSRAPELRSGRGQRRIGRHSGPAPAGPGRRGAQVPRLGAIRAAGRRGHRVDLGGRRRLRDRAAGAGREIARSRRLRPRGRISHQSQSPAAVDAGGPAPRSPPVLPEAAQRPGARRPAIPRRRARAPGLPVRAADDHDEPLPARPREVPLLFHVSDIAQFGRTSDLLSFWDGPLFGEDELLFPAEAPGRARGRLRLFPEQAATLRWLARNGVDVHLDQPAQIDRPLLSLWARCCRKTSTSWTGENRESYSPNASPPTPRRSRRC